MRAFLLTIFVVGSNFGSFLVWAGECERMVTEISGANADPHTNPQWPARPVVEKPKVPTSPVLDRGPSSINSISNNARMKSLPSEIQSSVEQKLSDLEFYKVVPSSDEIKTVFKKLMAEAEREKDSKDSEERRDANLKQAKYREAFDYLTKWGFIQPD